MQNLDIYNNDNQNIPHFDTSWVSIILLFSGLGDY
jgi:hypothetical protein